MCNNQGLMIVFNYFLSIHITVRNRSMNPISSMLSIMVLVYTLAVSG